MAKPIFGPLSRSKQITYKLSLDNTCRCGIICLLLRHRSFVPCHHGLPPRGPSNQTPDEGCLSRTTIRSEGSLFASRISPPYPATFLPTDRPNLPQTTSFPLNHLQTPNLQPICFQFDTNCPGGCTPPFLFPLFTTPCPLLTLPPVPLRRAPLGATMSQGARNLHDPGKQLRSPRCLRIVSGHRVRQAPRAVPG